MRNKRATLDSLIATCVAGLLLNLSACSTQPAHRVATTKYCAETTGIRAAKSIGCKDDNIGQMANTQAPNTTVAVPH